MITKAVAKAEEISLFKAHHTKAQYVQWGKESEFLKQYVVVVACNMDVFTMKTFEKKLTFQYKLLMLVRYKC